MTDSDYTDDLELLANTPAEAECLLHVLKQAAGGIGLFVNVNKTGFMCFKQEAISLVRGNSLKLLDNSHR